MKKQLSRCLTIVSLTFFVCACQTVPFSGRSRLMLTSENEEVEMGNQAWKEIMGKEKISTDKRLCSAVERVGHEITTVANKPDYKWEFKVIDSKQANAFCLPGGKVAVYSGLFQYVANDAELAVVIGHEIAHAIARHAGERISVNMVTATALAAVSEFTETDENILLALGIATQAGITLPYSREHEYEADAIGTTLMADAGYDPIAAVQFWKKFSSASPETPFIGDFLSTHPLGSKRIEELEALYPEASRKYENSGKKKGMGTVY